VLPDTLFARRPARSAPLHTAVLDLDVVMLERSVLQQQAATEFGARPPRRPALSANWLRGGSSPNAIASLRQLLLTLLSPPPPPPGAHPGRPGAACCLEAIGAWLRAEGDLWPRAGSRSIWSKQVQPMGGGHSRRTKSAWRRSGRQAHRRPPHCLLQGFRGTPTAGPCLHQVESACMASARTPAAQPEIGNGGRARRPAGDFSSPVHFGPRHLPAVVACLLMARTLRTAGG